MDAVIAWVDGNDPAHKDKVDEYMDRYSPHTEAAEPTRFRENGEIYFCLASILKFAPYIRRIFIVTDQQTPARLAEFMAAWSIPDDKIQIVDHREIFRGYEEFLPTFNSISIETMLHRIPGLSDEYVYFNDDFFLLRPVDPSYFFDEHGPRVRGAMKKYYKDRLFVSLRMKIRERLNIQQNKPGFRTSQQISALMVGEFPEFLQIGHHPHPLRRKTLETFFNEYPNVLPEQLQHRFRHHDQFSMVSLANHLEMSRNDITPGRPASSLYIKASRRSHKDIDKGFSRAKERNAACGCIQSLDIGLPGASDLILKHLRAITRDFPD